MIEFIIDNFFLIVHFLIYGGIALCIYAAVVKDKNKKKISYDVMKYNTDIRENNFTYNKEKISQNSRILTGVGMTAIVVGIILFVLGVVAVIGAIYILVHFSQFVSSLD